MSRDRACAPGAHAGEAATPARVRAGRGRLCRRLLGRHPPAVVTSTSSPPAENSLQPERRPQLVEGPGGRSSYSVGATTPATRLRHCSSSSSNLGIHCTKQWTMVHERALCWPNLVLHLAAAASGRLHPPAQHPQHPEPLYTVDLAPGARRPGLTEATWGGGCKMQH